MFGTNREMKIKTTLRFHFTPVRMAIIKNTNNNKCWKDVGKEYTHTLLVGLQIGETTMESGMEFSQKTWNGTTI